MTKQVGEYDSASSSRLGKCHHHNTSSKSAPLAALLPSTTQFVYMFCTPLSSLLAARTMFTCASPLEWGSPASRYVAANALPMTDVQPNQVSSVIDGTPSRKRLAEDTEFDLMVAVYQGATLEEDTNVRRSFPTPRPTSLTSLRATIPTNPSSLELLQTHFTRPESAC